MKTLLVTVDSLRRDRFSQMTKTTNFLDIPDTPVYATGPSTSISFQSILGGIYPSSELSVNSTIAKLGPNNSVGISTNRLVSKPYGYNSDFSTFSSPISGQKNSKSVKNSISQRLNPGSKIHSVAVSVWNVIQRTRSKLGGSIERDFRPSGSVIDEFNSKISGYDRWFSWLHFMEPHYPYNPDDGVVKREKAKRISRSLHSAGSSPVSYEKKARKLYDQEVQELDVNLSRLWDMLDEDVRVVFCADHGELLGKDGVWGHPAKRYPELYHVPFGTKNIDVSDRDLISLVDLPAILFEDEWKDAKKQREFAFAICNDEAICFDETTMVSTDGSIKISDGSKHTEAILEKKRKKFESKISEPTNRYEADKESLKQLGYLE